MFEQFLALLTRIAVALETIATAAPVTGTQGNVIAETAKDTATEDSKKSDAKEDKTKTTGRGRGRASAASNTDAGKGDAANGAGTADAAAGGRRTRSRATAGADENKPAEETAEQKALRARIEQIGVAFAEYPDLTEWVQQYVKNLGFSNITQIPASSLAEVAAEFEAKDKAEFGEAE